MIDTSTLWPNHYDVQAMTTISKPGCYYIRLYLLSPIIHIKTQFKHIKTISKPGYYYDTIIRYYDKCHKGKQGVFYSPYDTIMTLL
jgi:hypothetical protein